METISKAIADQPTNPTLKRRWFYPTPGRLIVVLLAVEGVLLLSERFQWFGFNEHKGWTVLIAVAAVGLFLLLMLIWFIVSLIFRWRFQFSIRSLLVLTIAVAIPCSWLAVEMKKAERQTEATMKIYDCGGIVWWDYQMGASRGPTVGTKPPGPTWLWDLLGDDFFVTVLWVRFDNPQFPDAALASLSGFTELERLDLNGTQVTDAGLEHVKGLTTLQELFLSGTQVTDVGLEHIKGLTTLGFVDLGKTRVTDAGLEHLKGLTHLQLLMLGSTQVTNDGVKKLQQALPNCKIEH